VGRATQLPEAELKELELLEKGNHYQRAWPSNRVVRSATCRGANLAGKPIFSSQGDRYLEMRRVKEHMSSKRFDKIPSEFRNIKRLWDDQPDQKGLLLRRDAEASLFALGLAS